MEGKLLTVSNSGSMPARPAIDFFERFKKEAASSESLRPGLSIVKKICESYHFPVSYNYDKKMHIIIVQFQPDLLI